MKFLQVKKKKKKTKALFSGNRASLGCEIAVIVTVRSGFDALARVMGHFPFN